MEYHESVKADKHYAKKRRNGKMTRQNIEQHATHTSGSETAEERVFTAYNGCASNPTTRSVKARLPRSMEDVLRIASKIKIFPRIAGRMAIMLTNVTDFGKGSLSLRSMKS